MYALPVFGALTIAMLDRLAAGDAVRAGVIASKMSGIWPDMRNAFASEMQQQGGVPSGTSWPASIPSSWTGDTQTIGVLSLQRQTAQGSALYTAAATLYDVPASQLATVARSVLATIPQGAQGRAYVASASSASPAALPGILDALISGTIATSTLPTVAAPSTTSSGASDPQPVSRPPVSTPIALPATVITATVPRPTSSNWPWYALGGAVAIGIAVFAVQRLRGAT